MAVAASRSPAGALAAGRHGLGMLSIGGTSDDAMKHHAGNWDLYAATATENGHTPDRKNWRLVTLMHIAETREQARENVKFGLDRFCDYFRDVATFPIVPNDITDRYQFMIESGSACIGTPDDAIAFIERLLQGSAWLRRDHGTGAELGRLGTDETPLRADGPVCSSALPVVPGMAQRKLRSGPWAPCRIHPTSGAAVQAEIDRLAAKRRAAE